MYSAPKVSSSLLTMTHVPYPFFEGDEVIWPLSAGLEWRIRVFASM